MYNNNHSSLRRECKQFPLSIKISPQVNVTSHHFFHFFHYSDFFEYLHFFEYLNFYNKKEIWLYNKTWVWGGGGGFSPLSGNGIPFTLFQLVSPDCGNWLTRWWNFHHMSQSQLVWSFESQSRVKVKVVKWCRKKWFDHNQMYIYHKQCEILQKNHRNSSNIQFQWFPIEKGRKLCKRKRWNGWSKSIF